MIESGKRKRIVKGANRLLYDQGSNSAAASRYKIEIPIRNGKKTAAASV